MQLKVIAHMRSDFPTKFGVPRQASLVSSLHSTVVFTPEYRDINALRGIEDFSWIWLVWGFSLNKSGTKDFTPLVRPPRLGGNKYLGVFATRSPYRPNPIAMSSVKLLKVEAKTPLGPILHVSGADLVDGTPIYDIKPYVPLDCHPEATPGFTAINNDYQLQVQCDPEILEKMDQTKREALLEVLAQDPRPAYQKDNNRIYWMRFAEKDIEFKVVNGVLKVLFIGEPNRELPKKPRK